MIIDERALQRIPFTLIFMLIIFSALPIMALNYFSMNINTLSGHYLIQKLINNSNYHASIWVLSNTLSAIVFSICLIKHYFSGRLHGINTISQKLCTSIMLLIYTAQITLTILTDFFSIESLKHIEILLYFMPITCLMINYIFYYNLVMNTQKKIHYIATHDALTGLYNRHEFETNLDKIITTSARLKDYFALLIIDIDDFKTINDTHGHIYGDSVLKQFTTQLTSLTRCNETLSRIGGDEFALITSRLESPDITINLAKRINHGLNIPYLINGTWQNITASIGISIYPKDGRTRAELLKHADMAMYIAKKGGKNTCRLYSTHKITLPTY